MTEDKKRNAETKNAEKTFLERTTCASTLVGRNSSATAHYPSLSATTQASSPQPGTQTVLLGTPNGDSKHPHARTLPSCTCQDKRVPMTHWTLGHVWRQRADHASSCRRTSSCSLALCMAPARIVPRVYNVFPIVPLQRWMISFSSGTMRLTRSV